jgi:tripartite ATP-independent transporter DctM subunit
MAATITFTVASLPMMRKFKYNDRLTLGAVAAGGMLAGLIPPSLPLILYGAITETSISQLLISGVFPGLLLAALYICTIYIWCLRNRAVGPPSSKATWKERWRGGLGMWTIVLIFVFIMGGIFLGLFTPTEAGAAGAFVVLVMGLARRRLNWQLFMKSLLDTGVTTGMVSFMIIGTMVFNRFVALTRLAAGITVFLSGITQSPVGILWIVVALYWVLGMFLSPPAIIFLTLPILYPTAVSVGIDPVHFGIVTTVVLMAGTLTPPFAPTAFAIAGMVKDISVFDIYWGSVPFLIAIIACEVFLIYLPQISLLLPSMMK